MLEMWIIFIVWGLVCFKIGYSKSFENSVVISSVSWVNKLLDMGFTRKQCLELIEDFDKFLDEYEIIIKQKTGQ
jgi:hypothetical protein